jgi:hypothetical protein
MKRQLRKVMAVLVTMAMLTSFLCSSVTANSERSNVVSNEMVLVSESVKYLDNGLILVTTITESIASNPRSTYTKSGTKTETIRNSSNEILFSLSVHGTFTVNPGVSAVCTSSRVSHTINSSAWSLHSSSASRSGNRAMATGLFQRKFLFVVVDSLQIDLTLTCSVNGVLS